MSIEQRLKELGIELPHVTTPAANYVPYTISGHTVIVSGQLPMEGGKPQFIGQLGDRYTVEDGQKCARLCALNVLAHLRVACDGSLDRVRRVLRLGVFVNSPSVFVEHPKVANGASDLMVEIFGAEKGAHARAAVGVAGLPFGVAVEVEGMFEIG